MKKTLILMAAALFAACGQGGKTAQTESGATDSIPAAEQEAPAATIAAVAKAPDFTLKTIEGQEVTLSSSFEGKYVVLDFWGIWCKWCVKGIPEMKEYYSKYASKMEIVSIDVNDDLQELKDYVRKEGMTWTHISDDTESENSLCQQYQVQGFPTKIIIDPQGNIVEVYVGEVPEFYEKLNELLN